MLKGWFTECKQAFTKMSAEDISSIDDSEIRDKHVGDGEGFTRSSGGEDGNGLEPGQRTDRWFRDVEKEVEENERRTLENQKMLTRLDMRTVWIMRLLVGVMVSVIGGAVLNITF